MTGQLIAKQVIQNELNSTSNTFEFGRCLLRHDVDKKPINSLRSAIIENELGIKGSYYFRIVPESYDFNIMQKIADLGHEIGYHYEDVDLVLKSQKSELMNQDYEINMEKLIDFAYESFCKNLDVFRRNFDISTICMHGSPTSRFDNKIIWEKYNYQDLNIVGEPYLDINWQDFGYLTDTGRKWNKNEISVRDKVNSKYKLSFKSTNEIIANIDKLPQKIMFTIHPQRWNENLFAWLDEYVSQNLKNIVKKYFYVRD